MSPSTDLAVVTGNGYGNVPAMRGGPPTIADDEYAALLADRREQWRADSAADEAEYAERVAREIASEAKALHAHRQEYAEYAAEIERDNDRERKRAEESEGRHYYREPRIERVKTYDEWADYYSSRPKLRHEYLAEEVLDADPADRADLIRARAAELAAEEYGDKVLTAVNAELLVSEALAELPPGPRDGMANAVRRVNDSVRRYLALARRTRVTGVKPLARNSAGLYEPMKFAAHAALVYPIATHACERCGAMLWHWHSRGSRFANRCPESYADVCARDALLRSTNALLAMYFEGGDRALPGGPIATYHELVARIMADIPALRMFMAGESPD